MDKYEYNTFLENKPPKAWHRVPTEYWWNNPCPPVTAKVEVTVSQESEVTIQNDVCHWDFRSWLSSWSKKIFNIVWKEVHQNYLKSFSFRHLEINIIAK